MWINYSKEIEILCNLTKKEFSCGGKLKIIILYKKLAFSTP